MARGPARQAPPIRVDAIQPDLPGAVSAVDLECSVQLLGRGDTVARGDERATVLVQGLRLVHAQPLPLERLLRLAECSVGCIGGAFGRQHDRLRERCVPGPPAPVLAGGDQLAAALGVLTRLAQAPALGPHASEIRLHPQLEVASATVADDRERLLEQPAGRFELAAEVLDPGGEVVRGPLVPAIPRTPTRFEHARGERLDLVPLSGPEVDERLERVRDPRGLRIGEEPARVRQLAPRRVAAADAVRDLLPVGGLADVGQEHRALEVALRLVGSAEPPRQLTGDVQRHPGQERPLQPICDVERAGERAQSLVQLAEHELVPRIRLCGAGPEHVVAEPVGDLHGVGRGLDPLLDPQAVGQRRRHAYAEMTSDLRAGPASITRRAASKWRKARGRSRCSA